ncbi:cyclic nucleotide-binding domain-containing protein [Loigolactobacillus bifermentans]|nr:cyclic nucleotide-binding domain-containing protein [Loigolactobacillus bifermentans]
MIALLNNFCGWISNGKEKNMDKFYPIILNSRLFQSLSIQELPDLLKIAQPQQRTYAAGQRIWQAGEQVTSLGLVCAGRVQIIKENPQGDRMIIATIDPADLFGEAYLYAGAKTLPVSVDAVSEATVLFFEPEALLEVAWMPEGKRIIRNLLQILSQKSLLLNKKVAILSQRKTADKVLVYLKTEAKRQQTNPLKIPYNRQEMADYLGVERSALSAALSDMKQAGLLDYHKNEFTLHPFQ